MKFQRLPPCFRDRELNATIVDAVLYCKPRVAVVHVRHLLIHVELRRSNIVKLVRLSWVYNKGNFTFLLFTFHPESALLFQLGLQLSALHFPSMSAWLR